MGRPIIFVPACVFNQRMMARGLPERGSWPCGAITPLIEIIDELGLTPYALACTEREFVGPNREPMSKAKYKALPGFVDHASKRAKETAQIIQKHKRCGQRIFAILGMSYSPACAVKVQYPPKKGGDPGLFMGVLADELVKLKIVVPMRDINRRGMNETIKWLRSLNEPKTSKFFG